MSFTNQTTHYGLPQWIGSDKPTYLVDQNNAYQTIDSELYNANTASGEAVTTANGAVTTAAGAASTAATALSTAQGAETTANTADGKADNAITLAQSAQTAAGAAQTAAEAAQTAAAGNSITNLAPAYDPTQTYAVGALVTQDGKLYQCITQVTTPEAFDINRWDDKTASEVFFQEGTSNLYGYHKSDIYTIEANTFSTISDAFSWIHSHPQTIFNLNTDEIATNIIVRVAFESLLKDKNDIHVSSQTTELNLRCDYTILSSNTIDIYDAAIASSPAYYQARITTSPQVSINDKVNNLQSHDIEIIWNVFKKI